MKKICVYAICKNESKVVDRWVQSLQGEADCVVVLDTGSTDDSVEKLQKYSPFVTVKQFDYYKELGYFRFDKARNDSLKLVPYDADICVILDLDHVPRPGWSNIIREKFEEGYTEVYGVIVDHIPNTTIENNRWTSRNVHLNSPFWIWTKVIHEGIHYFGNGENRKAYSEDFIIDHYPDETKDRSLYRNLLEYACKTYPKDPYYGNYLGIELSRRYSEQEAAKAFKRCIDECEFDADNTDLKYQCYINYAAALYEPANPDRDLQEALHALDTAESCTDTKRRRLYELRADIYEALGDYDNMIHTLETALSIQSYSNDWRDDAKLFNGGIEDRLSLSYYYHRNDPLKALEYAIKALNLHGNIEDEFTSRVKSNMKYYYDAAIGE